MYTHFIIYWFFFRGKQTSIDLSCPRYLGPALETSTVCVASSSGVVSELLSLKGKDDFHIEPIGKENRLEYV